MLKTALITGGCGFIGLAVVEAFLRDGWYVTVLDKLNYASNKPSLYLLADLAPEGRLKFRQIAIQDVEELPESDVIVNLAASTHVERSIVSPTEFLEDNVLGTVNLLELVRKRIKNCSDPPLFFHISTDEVYGDAPEGISFDETAPLRPRNPYSASKAAADHFVQTYHTTHGLIYNILRPTNNYGPFQHREKLVPLTVLNLMRGQKVKVHNNGDPRRVWLHSSDTANAILKIIESGTRNEIYNCSGGFEQSNIQTIRQIIEAFQGHKFDGFDYQLLNKYVDLSYSRQGQDLRYSLDDSKLRAIGWEPQFRFPDAIESVVKYYKESFTAGIGL